jgi:hypothetical protein
MPNNPESEAQNEVQFGMTDCAAYRTQNWVTRAGRPLCAEPLGGVLNAGQGGPPDHVASDQLAADLSGRYGPFALQFTGQHTGTVKLDGTVYDCTPSGSADTSKEAGGVLRRFCRDPETSEIVAHHDLLYLHKWARRRKFSTALWDEIKPYYQKSGVARIELFASLDDGGFVWARAGYSWDPEVSRLEKSLASVRRAAEQMESSPAMTPADRALLRAVIDSVHPYVDDLPSPQQLAMLSTDDSPNLGRNLMRQAQWYGVLYL